MAVSDIDIQRFKRDLDQAIAVANREIIHPLIPDVIRDSVLPLALSVARLRGWYLQAAFDIAAKDHGDAPDQNEIDELRHHREMYEEGRLAFDACDQTWLRRLVRIGRRLLTRRAGASDLLLRGSKTQFRRDYRPDHRHGLA